MADVKWSDNVAFPVVSPIATDYLVGLGGGGVNNNKFLISALTALILTSPVITGHATIEGVTATGATGTGKLVFDTAPTLGAITVTSVNKVVLTAPATAATLTIANNKTLTVSNSLALAGTDSTVMTFPTTSATVARTDAAQTFTGVQTFSTPIATGSVATMTATVGGGVPTPPNNTTTFLRGDGTFAAPASGAITIGSTTIASGTTTRILYDNAGVVGEYTLTGSGTVVAMQTSPSLITPLLGVATATSVAVGGGSIGSDALEITGTTTFNGNVTYNAASLILSGNISAAAWTTAGLRYKGVAFSATDTSSSGTVAAAYTNLFGVGTILASSATTYTNYYNTYFQDPVASTNVTMTNKWALGADTLKITGSSSFAAGTFSGVLSGLNAIVVASSFAVNAASGNVGVWNGGELGFSSSATVTSSVTTDATFMRLGAANIRQGKAPSATPIAQIFTLGEASRPGTDTNIGGANGTLQSGLGTSAGTPSSLIFQTPVTVGGTTTVQTYATRLTLGLSAVFGSAAIATNATDGFIYIATCAGTPTGVPTTQTGRVAMVYDTTNHQFWIYDAAWLQPKTPAAAAIVNWQ